MPKRYDDDMSMDEIMRRWPETIRVLLDHGLLCVGCPVASFHTLDDAISEHGIKANPLRADILTAIAEKEAKARQLRSDRPSAKSSRR